MVFESYSFTKHNVFEFHLWCSATQYFPFYGLFPLCGNTTFCLFNHQLMYLLVISTFQLLWVVFLWTFVYKFLFDTYFNSLKKFLFTNLFASMWVYLSTLWKYFIIPNCTNMPRDKISNGYVPRSEIAVVTLCFTCWGSVQLFSTAATPFYISTSSAQEFRFLHIIATTCYFPLIFFYYSHSSLCKLVSHCGFHLYFLSN